MSNQSHQQRIRIEVMETAIMAVPFRLKIRGTKCHWNVSAADYIHLTARVMDEEGLQRDVVITASPHHPLSNWADGKVIVVLRPENLTNIIGRHSVSFAVEIGGERIPCGAGFVEVTDRFGVGAQG